MEISFFQCFHLFFHTLFLFKEMKSPKHRAVSQNTSQPWNLFKKFLFFYFPQHIFLEKCRYFFHFFRNLCIVICEICVRSLCIHDTQTVLVSLKIRRNLFYRRRLSVFKINMYQAPYGACHLVHKAAGFSEINIFRELSGLSDLHRIDFHIIIKSGKNRSQKNLKGC